MTGPWGPDHGGSATIGGEGDAAASLLEHGARPDGHNCDGTTLLDCAVYHWDLPEMAELLRQYGGRESGRVEPGQ